MRVTIRSGEVEISKPVFLSLLDLSPVQEYAAYRRAVATDSIPFTDLKELAQKADVPFPLFFAPLPLVMEQIDDKDTELMAKLPSKEEMHMNSRGGVKIQDIELIAKDLSRKQGFLKKRILPAAARNPFIAMAVKGVKSGWSNIQIADLIRDYFGINLTLLRNMSKARILAYLTEKIEQKNILVSFRSYNFMPQNINPETGFSGICIKDKKFPTIFINTRDGEEKPKILETQGRQIFSLLSMVVNISMNRFMLNVAKEKKISDVDRRVYEIVGEILIPTSDLISVSIGNLAELKEWANHFRVTPSMMLTRAVDAKKVTKADARKMREILKKEVEDVVTTPKRNPLLTTGYGKYNGARFSKEVIGALKKKVISAEEAKNILFRKNKTDPNLLKDYQRKYEIL